MQEPSRKIYFFLVTTAVLWGANPIAVKHILGELSPLLIVLVRFLGISAILLGVLLIKEGRKVLPPRRHIPALLLMGFTGIGLNNGLQFVGLQYSTATNCVLVSALNPAMTSLLAVVFLKEQMIGRQWLGILISFLGVIFLVAHGSFEVLKSLSFNVGDVLFLGGQLGWAIYTLLGRQVLQDLSPMATTAWAGLAGTLFVGAAAWLDGGSPSLQLSYLGWLSMLYLIVGSGILAFNWWNEGVSAVGPSRVAVFANIIPIAGIALSVVLLQEHVGWKEIGGGVCILLGVYLTNGKKQERTTQAA